MRFLYTQYEVITDDKCRKSKIPTFIVGDHFPA